MLHRKPVIMVSLVLTTLALAASPALAALPAQAATTTVQARGGPVQPAASNPQPAASTPSPTPTPAPTPSPTPSPTPGRGHTLRYLAYKYAASQAGKWYCWGGAGPVCYDCSGLVFAAYLHEGITLDRTTYGMLASNQLIKITHAQARAGDLAFYGTGHVELFDKADMTFGAHDTGTQLSLVTYGPYWHPTAFYRVRGARQRAPAAAS